jgi:hypothetical protein
MEQLETGRREFCTNVEGNPIHQPGAPGEGTPRQAYRHQFEEPHNLLTPVAASLPNPRQVTSLPAPLISFLP